MMVFVRVCIVAAFCLTFLAAYAQSADRTNRRNGIVHAHGRLKAVGPRIVDKNGNSFSVSGNSFFWSQWMGQYYTAEVVDWLRSDWHSSVVRVAVGITQDGYLGKPEQELEKAYAVINAAISNDIYVIVDWHDHTAQRHEPQAIEFFQKIAKKYSGYPNVMYEIFNEPAGAVSWQGAVKPYSEKVIAAIRAIDKRNLILVGSPHWSQDVDVAAADPIKAENIAYTLHFYAGTHKAELRQKALVALSKGVALFVTEWGTCNANGNGGVDRKSTDEWFAFMKKWNLSNCNWSVADKVEAASIIKPKASVKGGWTENELTESGAYVRSLIRSWAGVESSPTSSATKRPSTAVRGFRAPE